MNRIALTVALVLTGCAQAQQATLQAPPEGSPPAAPANSDIRQAFDHVDQSGPTGRDF